jgi:uncharacterized protein YbaP (TraB family)
MTTWAQRFLSFLSKNEKELKTIWKIEKDGRCGYIAGTAHFSLFRYQKSLERLIRKAQIVLFEGPLDEQSMKRVVELGSLGEGSVALYERLDPQTIRQIKKRTGMTSNDSNPLPLFIPLSPKEADPLYVHFQKFQPWLAFLSLWTQYLKEGGWKYSVDLEAFTIAGQMGREIHFLETIDEQVQALEGVPFERFVAFLRKVHLWDEHTKRQVQLYQRGGLEEIMSGTSEFPTRCPSIIEDRDPIFYERMKPYLEKAKTVAFVGTAHIPGLKKMFLRDGYTVDQEAETGP